MLSWLAGTAFSSLLDPCADPLPAFAIDHLGSRQGISRVVLFLECAILKRLYFAPPVLPVVCFPLLVFSVELPKTRPCNELITRSAWN